MKKIFKLFALVLFVSIFSFSAVFAEEIDGKVSVDVAKNQDKGIIIAESNIINARITSQKENKFNISFMISNGEGVQTGIKYGINLYKLNNEKQVLVDSKIYDDSLTLNSNSKINKDIVYEAPMQLSGDYELYVFGSNDLGLIFSSNKVADIKLESTAKGLYILTDNCYFSQSDSTDKYGLSGFVRIDPNATLNLTCDAYNNGDKEIEVTPWFEIRSGSIYEDVLGFTNESTTPVSFGSNETKGFSVVVPKAMAPGDYFLNFALANDSYKSNIVSASYNIKGATARILNLSLDKDLYKKGETALVKLSYSNTDVSSLQAQITISDGKDKACAVAKDLDLSEFKPLVESSIQIDSKCVDPQIVVKLTDDKGNVLDEKVFNVETTSPQINYILVLIIILIIIIIIFGFKKFMKNKKIDGNSTENNSNSMGMNIFFLGFILASLLTFIPMDKVQADSFVSPDGYVTGYFTLTNNDGPYSPNEGINFTGLATIRPAGMLDGTSYEDVFGIEILVYTAENYSSRYVRIPGYAEPAPYLIGGLVPADKTDGIHYVYLTVSYSYMDSSNIQRDRSVPFSFSYSVVVPSDPDPIPSTPKIVDVNAKRLSNNSIIPKNTKDVTIEPIAPKTGIIIEWRTDGFNSNVICTPPDGVKPKGTNSGSLLFEEGEGPDETTTYSVSCDDGTVSTPSYPPTSSTSCFIADTMVTLADGTKKDIQDIKIGDVLKGEKTDNTVLGLHRPTLDGKLYSINGGRYFVTEEHPFKTTDGWKAINPDKTEKNIGIIVTKLNVGDTLITDKGQILIQAIDSKIAEATTPLFNFFLTGDHTYYADGYLVHNKTACDLSGNDCPVSQTCVDSGGYTVGYNSPYSSGFCVDAI